MRLMGFRRNALWIAFALLLLASPSIGVYLLRRSEDPETWVSQLGAFAMDEWMMPRLLDEANGKAVHMVQKTYSFDIPYETLLERTQSNLKGMRCTTYANGSRWYHKEGSPYYLLFNPGQLSTPDRKAASQIVVLRPASKREVTGI